MGLLQEARKMGKIGFTAGSISFIGALPFIAGCSNTNLQPTPQPIVWSVPESTPTLGVTPPEPPTPEPEILEGMTESMKALFLGERFALWKEKLPRGTVLTITDYGKEAPRKGIVTAKRGLNERTEPDSSRDETVRKVHLFETELSWQIEIKVEKPGKPVENWATIRTNAWIALVEGEENFVRQYPPPPGKPAVFAISNQTGK